MANLPLLWIFGTRNDILLWLSGWTFATFNRFHRWVARVAVAQAVAHSVAYTFQLIYSKHSLLMNTGPVVWLTCAEKSMAGYIGAWKQDWFYAGVVVSHARVCCRILLI